MANPIEGNTNSWFNHPWWKRPWVKDTKSPLSSFPSLGRSDIEGLYAIRDRLLASTDIRSEVVDELDKVPLQSEDILDDIGTSGYYFSSPPQITVDRRFGSGRADPWDILMHEYSHAFAVPNNLFPEDSTTVQDWLTLVDDLKNSPHHQKLSNFVDQMLSFYPPNLPPHMKAHEQFAYINQYRGGYTNSIPSRLKEWFKKYLLYDKPTGFREEFNPYIKDYLPNAK